MRDPAIPAALITLQSIARYVYGKNVILQVTSVSYPASPGYLVMPMLDAFHTRVEGLRQLSGTSTLNWHYRSNLRGKKLPTIVTVGPCAEGQVGTFEGEVIRLCFGLYEATLPSTTLEVILPVVTACLGDGPGQKYYQCGRRWS